MWRVGDNAFLLRERRGEPYWFYVTIEAIHGTSCTVRARTMYWVCELDELQKLPIKPKEKRMITRKTLKLFGCHEAAVEQFAREAGLPVEETKKAEPEFNIGDWVRVKDTADGRSDSSIRGWVGKVADADEHTRIVYVDFFGRPMPHAFGEHRNAGKRQRLADVWARNLEKV